MLRDGRWKYIAAPRPELYDLRQDPTEAHNLVAAEPARATALRTALEARLRSERASVETSPAGVGVPADLLEKLGAPATWGPGALCRGPRQAPTRRTRSRSTRRSTGS